MNTAASDELRWFVCHTKPRCEKKFAALLLAEKIEHYLPTTESVKRYGQRTRSYIKPLFPGYVFAQIKLENKPRIYQQDLLARTIAVGNEVKFLRQMADVRAMLASGLDVIVRPIIERGTRVKVISGPLWGLEGVVDDPVSPKGIIVAIDVLQQGLHVCIGADCLETLA